MENIYIFPKAEVLEHLTHFLRYNPGYSHLYCKLPIDFFTLDCVIKSEGKGIISNQIIWGVFFYIIVNGCKLDTKGIYDYRDFT